MAEKNNNVNLWQNLREIADRVPPPEALAALHKGADAATSKPLFFICGALKSGTTWLQLMLNAHPEIACRGEGHLLNFLLPGLGKALQEYNSKIGFKNRSIFNEIEGYPRFAEPQHYALLQMAVSLLLAQYDGENIRIIGEKSPDNVLGLHLFARLFPHVKFLHLIRDGRDGAVSGWFHNLRVSKEWAETGFGDLKGFAENYAKSWVRSIRAGQEFGAEFPESYYEVRYEDLLSDGETELRGILKFLGASADKEEIINCLQASSFKNLAKGRGAGKEDRDSHFRKGVQGDWRPSVDDQTHANFRSHAGAQLVALGYDD
ncbi:MAG: sulfotransferase [Proteobacteria bacterium]|nr:sulfotransferase [Pseudomonadota bacterium]